MSEAKSASATTRILVRGLFSRRGPGSAGSPDLAGRGRPAKALGNSPLSVTASGNCRLSTACCSSICEKAGFVSKGPFMLHASGEERTIASAVTPGCSAISRRQGQNRSSPANREVRGLSRATYFDDTVTQWG
jgi:hypothetical protein